MDVLDTLCPAQSPPSWQRAQHGCSCCVRAGPKAGLCPHWVTQGLFASLLLLKAFSVPEDEVAACLSPRRTPVAQRTSSYLPRARTRSLDPHHQELLDIDSHKRHYSNTVLLCNCSVCYTSTSRTSFQKEQAQYFQQNICSPEVQLQKYPKTRDAF